MGKLEFAQHQLSNGMKSAVGLQASAVENSQLARPTGYGLRVTGYGLRVTHYVLRISKHDGRVDAPPPPLNCPSQLDLVDRVGG